MLRGQACGLMFSAWLSFSHESLIEAPARCKRSPSRCREWRAISFQASTGAAAPVDNNRTPGVLYVPAFPEGGCAPMPGYLDIAQLASLSNIKAVEFELHGGVA